MKKARLIIISALLVVLIALFLRFRWHPLDYYTPGDGITLAAPFRTMAEHDAFMADRAWPYVLRLDYEDAALVYYGSWHTQDPEDPQIAEIQRLWDEFGPTVAVTENRMGLFAGTLPMGVSVFGEFATMYALGRRDGLPVYTLEPRWDAEVAEMKQAFPAEEVTLFYTLRVFLSERGDADPDEVDDLAAHLLKKRGSRPGLEGTLPDLAALDRLWDERFAHLGPWRELPRGSVDPSAGGTRLNEIATIANEIRDRHAVRVILDLMGRGERVFAVAGGSHVVKQEPVIRAGIEGPTLTRYHGTEAGR